MKKALAIALLSAMIASPISAVVPGLQGTRKGISKFDFNFPRLSASITNKLTKRNGAIAAVVVLGSVALYQAYKYCKNNKANA